MAIIVRQNQYQGVNAHLQSYFQAEGGWKSFHNNHIGDLAKTIAELLPAGYTVDIEQSLQIEIDDTADYPEPDATIYELPERPKEQFSPSSGGQAATLILPITQTLAMDEDRYRNAVVIYKSEGHPLGRPVTRIELLSPTNKRGRGRQRYVEKREFALRGGLPLVEIDYFHETPPVAQRIPRYSRKDEDTHPYLILVSDPRPTLWEGKALVYGFDVDDPIPTINIPLSGDEVLPLDFGKVYHQTFASLPAYGRRVDYAQLPRRVETYNARDRERIQERMRIVCEQHGQM